jgi:glycosyltransferase involved in cell wall biosynthesis
LLKRKNRIAIFASEPVTGRIGGLGIRQLEITRVLSSLFEVRLLTPYEITDHKEKFPIKKISYEYPNTIETHVRWADLIYAHHPAVASYAKKYKTPVAVDLLVHEYFESLEREPLKEMEEREKNFHFSNSVLNLSRQLAMGDFFVCPSERSRDYYLGALTLIGKLDPKIYLKDPEFKSIIDIVPFGMPSIRPKKGKHFFREKLPGVKKNDFIILWGGTLANWYDVETPLKAMKRICQRHPKIKLIFTGFANPMQTKPTETYVRSEKLAKQWKLLDKSVFFYKDWIPYENRQYYLTECDAGIVTFADHLENRFSQRIRLLDYVWAGLPVLTNGGNVLGDWIRDKELGKTVPFGDDKMLAKIIVDWSENSQKILQIKKRMSVAKKDLSWKRVCNPLIRFFQDPRSLDSLFQRGEYLDWQSYLTQESIELEGLSRSASANPYLRPMIAKRYLKIGDKNQAEEILLEHNKLFGQGLDNPIFRFPIFGIAPDLDQKELIKICSPLKFQKLLQAKDLMNQGDLDTAENLIIEEIRLTGETPEAQLCHGLLLQKRENHLLAIKEFKKVQTALPERYECWLPLADSMVKTGKKKPAEKLYLAAWNKAENWEDGWVRTRIAVSMAELNKNKIPIYQTLEGYRSKDPENEGLGYALASNYESWGKKKEARELFNKFTQTFRNDNLRAAALFRFARLSPKKNRRPILKECLRLIPDHGGAKKMLKDLKKL